MNNNLPFILHIALFLNVCISLLLFLVSMTFFVDTRNAKRAGDWETAEANRQTAIASLSLAVISPIVGIFVVIFLLFVDKEWVLC